VRFPNGSELHGYGHYREHYEKTGGEWLIKASTLTRLRLDFTVSAGQDEGQEPGVTET
jgi:hypothetical protein